MIKPIQFLMLMALSFCFAAAKAQKISEADSTQQSKAEIKSKTFFFELGGPGAIYSVNYDIRFSKKPDGLGGRSGISFFADDETTYFTVPVMVNYLLGKKNKYFEIGAGVTIFTFKSHGYYSFFGNKYSIIIDENGHIIYPPRKRDTGVLGTLNFGYRYQPIDGGFNFRAGVSPVFSSRDFLPYWPYVSFGYTF